jgi:hypothetical protein
LIYPDWFTELKSLQQQREKIMQREKIIHHKGSLTITGRNAYYFSALESVSGTLSIMAEVELPAIKSVGKTIYIHTHANMPELVSVGGDMNVYSKSNFPSLVSVGGDLTVDKPSSMHALKSVGGHLYMMDACESPALEMVMGHMLPPKDTQDARIKAIAEIVLSKSDALDMHNWHVCETTHCLAGWAIHNEGKDGCALEHELGPATAGAILLGAEAASYFFTNNVVVREWLESKLHG